MSIYFEVKKWLDKEEYEKLLTIADYLGWSKERGSKFVINFDKIHRNNMNFDEVVSILEELGIFLNKKSLEKIKEHILSKRTVKLVWDRDKVVLQTPIYLGDRFKEIKNFIIYDRYLKKIYVKPLHFFDLKRKLSEIGLRVIDETGISETLKLPFTIELNVVLRDYQLEALNTWFNRGAKGIIALPTGAGKTVIAIAAIAKLSERTLVVTYTKEQMFQWREMITKFTSIRRDYIGLYYGEEKRLSPITISTYQTAYRHINFLAKYFSFLIIDECLTGDTLIIMNDGGVKELKDVKNGEKVLGGIVSNKFSKRSNDLYYIKSSFTDLIATGTHPHIVVRERGNKHIKQKFKAAVNDITVIPTYKLRVGDYFLVPEKIPHVAKRNWKPEQLRLVALIACNGCIECGKPVVKVEVKKCSEKEWVRKIFIEGVKAFNICEPICEFVNSQENYTISCNSPKLVRILTKVFNIPRGEKANIIDISNEIFYSPLESIKAFIEVCFSCRGWLTEGKTNDKKLCFACNSKKFVNKLQLLLKKFAIHSGFTIRRIKGRKHNSLYQLYIGDLDFNRAMELFNFPRKLLNTSERNVDKNINGKLGPFRLVRITKIEKINSDMKVYDFTSNGSHTFFANGVWTHNCHHLPSDKFKYIAMNSFAPKRMGLSATVVREDGKHEELFPLMGGIVYYKSPSELAIRGYLAPYVIYPVEVTLTPKEYEKYKELYKIYRELASGEKFNVILEKAKSGDIRAQNALRVHSKLRQIVHKAENKKKAVEKIVKLELKRGSKIIIFTQYVDQAKELGKLLNAPVLVGETETRKRQKILRDFKEGKTRVLVVTTVGDEGLDIPDANVGIIVTGTGSRRQFIQRLGRLLRPSKGKEARLYEIVVRGTLEELQSKRRKSFDLIENLFK